MTTIVEPQWRERSGTSGNQSSIQLLGSITTARDRNWNVAPDHEIDAFRAVRSPTKGCPVARNSSMTSSPVGSPPRFIDPRRWGTLIGLFGAGVFVFSYTPGSAGFTTVAARILVIAAITGTLWFLFGSPRFLGPFSAPRGRHIGIYLLCVIMEFALIAFGTGRLTSVGKLELQPALIALVVGLHFIPFAWAFRERMFYTLGSVLALLGGAGLLIGTGTSALTAAVGAGLMMSLILLAYSLGMFAGPRPGNDR